MRKFAQVNEDNLLINVAEFEDDCTPVDLDWPNWYETAPNIRKNVAAPGFTFVLEAPGYPLGFFYPPSSYKGWVLDENYEWQPPADKPYPEGFGAPPCLAYWDDDIEDWAEATPIESE